MERDLEYIYTVYKTGSFSKAAEFLYATQPTVSMAVQRVEEDLGYPVFVRKSKPLKLTEEGKQLMEHVERIRESEKLLWGELDRLNGSKKERLHIGCTPIHAHHLFPEVLFRFMAMAPDVEITLINGFPWEMNRDLRDYKIDIAVNTMSEADPTDFIYIPAFEVYYLFAVPPDFPVNRDLKEYAFTAEEVVNGKALSKKGPFVPISAFQDTPFIDFTEGSEFFEQSRKIFRESGFAPRTNLTVYNPSMAREMAQRGMGATIVGNFLVKKSSPLLYYRLRTDWGERSFYFVMRKDHALLKHQELFIQIFRDVMKEKRGS